MFWIVLVFYIIGRELIGGFRFNGIIEKSLVELGVVVVNCLYVILRRDLIFL